jgi:hypothetical protein
MEADYRTLISNTTKLLTFYNEPHVLEKSQIETANRRLKFLIEN